MSDENEKYIREFVANRVNELLAENKIKNKKTLSHLIGHGENFVSTLTNKKHNPMLASVYDFCDYFGMTLEDFFHEDDSKDKIIRQLNHLLTEKLNVDDLTLLFNFVDTLDKKSLRALLETYSTYHAVRIEKESKKTKIV
ncbi:helix-turn-helix domain-containing protein [Christensenella hongkongensis]|nr:helix-turn-helix transcriptional regulator [Christensenella hongkongensis]TCW25514.1 Cro/C1-type helix-turn-helix DNA-binding protein [Christensenella hongkongensis]